jgi:uncharacterized protein HemX
VDVLELAVKIGPCSKCHTAAYLRGCLKCPEILCERCLARHQQDHDPGGLGIKPSAPQPRLAPDSMEMSPKSPITTVALILAIVACGLAGYREVQIADRDATRREQIASLQEKVKDLGDRLGKLEEKADHNTRLLERLIEGQERRR